MRQMTRQRRILLGLAAAVAAAAGGCMVGPDYHDPKVSVPAAWVGPTTAPAATQSATQAATMPAMTVDLAQWWRAFNDPQLNTLVERAIAQNLDVKLAESRIRQARANRGVVASGLFPTANADADFSRGRTPAGDKGITSNAYRAGLDATWELDVFGGVRRGIESSEAGIQFSVEDRRNTLVTLVAEVGLNYSDLRSFQQQIVIAKRNLQTQKDTAALTRKRFGAGLSGSLDVANADAQVATTGATIPALEASARQTIYSLSLLLGREPGALLQELAADGPIPPTPPEIPAGLPSDLLRRRPDIRSAEANIHAATAQVGVATADLFPKFTLTGSLGFEASKLADMGNLNNRFWSFGPAMSWALFDAGRIASNIEVQKALTEQSVLTYQKIVLGALQETESALVAYSQERQTNELLKEAVAANRKAVELSTKLYTQGQTDFLSVLDTQRSLFASEVALVRSTESLNTDLIAVYKALGGGWEEEGQPAASQPATRPR